LVASAPLSDERLPIYTSNTFEIQGLQLEQHIGLCWGLSGVFRMIEHAKALGGNAVVGVRFDSNSSARERRSPSSWRTAPRSS
jgi:hypothetical protein